MTACKFKPLPYTPPNLPKFGIKKASLPVICKLRSPPTQVTIARARFYDAAGHTTTLDVASNGLSFNIPSSVAAGDGDLEVRIQVASGGPNPITPVDLIEDCPGSQLILTITDSGSKAAAADVVVQS